MRMERRGIGVVANEGFEVEPEASGGENVSNVVLVVMEVLLTEVLTNFNGGTSGTSPTLFPAFHVTCTDVWRVKKLISSQRECCFCCNRK